MTHEKVEYVEVKKETLTLERIALAAVVALLSWNVYTTNQLTIAQAVTSQQLEGLNNSFNAIALDRYTKTEANAKNAALENRMVRLEQWNERMANRVTAQNSDIADMRQDLRDVKEDKRP